MSHASDGPPSDDFLDDEPPDDPPIRATLWDISSIIWDIMQISFAIFFLYHNLPPLARFVLGLLARIYRNRLASVYHALLSGPVNPIAWARISWSRIRWTGPASLIRALKFLNPGRWIYSAYELLASVVGFRLLQLKSLIYDILHRVAHDLEFRILLQDVLDRFHFAPQVPTEDFRLPNLADFTNLDALPVVHVEIRNLLIWGRFVYSVLAFVFSEETLETLFAFPVTFIGNVWRWIFREPFGRVRPSHVFMIACCMITCYIIFKAQSISYLATLGRMVLFQDSSTTYFLYNLIALLFSLGVLRAVSVGAAIYFTDTIARIMRLLTGMRRRGAIPA
ncbi:hypothetical protein F5Y11DRAFT_349471 [Daldinia sp. FL1419]|nr:hypothetical protein F5Y11DRAFT_349471 [Daldinia sp. FL1419]